MRVDVRSKQQLHNNVVSVGRLTTWGCSCNLNPLWNSDTNNMQHASKHVFDPYSFTHMFWGATCSVVLQRLGFVGNLLIHLVWEVVENSPPVIRNFRKDHLNSEYQGDSVQNMLGDLLAFSVGWGLMSTTRARWKMVQLLLILEAVPLLWVGDCVTRQVYTLGKNLRFLASPRAYANCVRCSAQICRGSRATWTN